MNLPGHTTPRGPHLLNTRESGTHAQGTAGHLATTTLRSRRASRLTNDGAGAGVPTTVPGDIPTQFAPVGPEAPKATRAPRAPAGHCRTDGRAAWGGYGPTAATAPGASAGWSTTSNFSPRSLISTTTPPLPVPSTSGSSEQINVAYHPHHYQVPTQGYTNVTSPSPSHHPVLRPGAGGALPPSNPRPPAPLYGEAAGQHAYHTGSAGAPSSQCLASHDVLNQTHQTPVSPQAASFTQGSRSLVPDTGHTFTPSLAVPSQGDSVTLCICNGDHWFAWCNLAWEHYNTAMNSPPPLILLPCTCPPRLLNGAVPKSCPKAAGHLLTWLHVYNKIRANQFIMAAANNPVPQNAILQSYKRAASQDTADRNPTSPSRETETGHPQQGSGGLESLFSAPSTPTTPSHITRPPFTSPLARITSPPTQDIRQHSDVTQNFDSLVSPLVSPQSPLGGDPYSVPVQVVAIDPSDTVGPSSPSRPPPHGGSLSNRRKASLNAINPPAKRARRVLQPNATGNAATQVGSTDESLGFGSLAHQPEVQKAMRDLVAAIRISHFFLNKKLEPNLGALEAVGLVAGASDGLWRGYGTKAKSIYSLFIRVDGKECKCLWCGDVQKGKLQRAVGHFRAKHLGHEPFLCDDLHVGNEVCNVRFASLEAMGEHKRRKEKLKTNGKLPCTGCDRFYISVSNLNRHREKCGSNQADPGYDDDDE